jgi:TPR repeat protein
MSAIKIQRWFRMLKKKWAKRLLNRAIEALHNLKFMTAMSLLNEAIRAGSLPARAYLAWICLQNDDRRPDDPKYVQAVQLVKIGANQGCYDCQGVLAVCHTDGKGMEGGKMNLALAFVLARESERNGSVFGIFALANLIKFGLDKEDIPFAEGAHRSVGLFQEAANRGFTDAFKQLVMAYESGYGVPQDYVAARTLLEYLVDKGDGWACKRLSSYYRKGLGVEKDRVKAKELGDKAFHAGYYRP